MQLTLVQTEIEEALRQYVTNQVAVKDGKRIDITLRATRGADGYQAIIDIVSSDSPNASDASESGGMSEATSAAASSGPQGEVQESVRTPEAKAEPEVTAAASGTGSGKKLFGNVAEPVNA